MSDGLLQKRPIQEAPHPEQAEKHAEKHERPSAAPTERHPAEKPKAAGAPAAIPTAAPVRPLKKSALLSSIENVLEEGLLSIYKDLTPKQRKQFKHEGERVAATIEKVLKKAQVKLIELIRIIRRWLQMLPGVNVFFLEQEAKIKAEKILSLKGPSDIHAKR
ncbi:hypothetical protein HY732_03225 [Candidatus Uhrbacteria bacterium]|nr:hypothetical protein [Candidatus Uhrbacteria bacterium]